MKKKRNTSPQRYTMIDSPTRLSEHVTESRKNKINVKSDRTYKKGFKV